MNLEHKIKLKTKSGLELEADFCVIAIGVRPNVTLAKRLHSLPLQRNNKENELLSDAMISNSLSTIMLQQESHIILLHLLH